MNIKGISYYVNPNKRTLTMNIKNTAILDPTNFASVQKQLRPVDNMAEVLKTPIPLATETFINKRLNSINIASGASISVAGGFTLTVSTGGVSISGKTNLNNQKEAQEAQNMAGALATLLRNAGGTLQNAAHSSAAYDKWTKNISKVMGYLGIDTSKDFIINGMKYTQNEDGRFVLQSTIDAMTAYEQLKSANLSTVPDCVVLAGNETTEGSVDFAKYISSGDAKTDDFYSGLSSAVEVAESKGTGDVLGLTMLPYSDSISYGMSAFYSEKSTPSDPVIRINSNYGGENRYFDVHVNEVDPSNASQLEMFALSCYMDEQGITDSGTFGSYSRIKTYALNASYFGHGIDLRNPESLSVQFDWVSMLQRMANEYMKNAQTYSQYLDCNTLVTTLSNWI